LFFVSLNTLAQITTSYSKVIDSTFNIETFETLDYTPFKKKVTHGAKKTGRYVIKIDNVASTSILQIPSIRIKEIAVYQAGEIIPNYKPSLYNSYLVRSGSPIYALINNTRHTFIPIEVTEEMTYFSAHTNNMFAIGLYYGLVFMVLLFNLFYYFKFKDITFLYYSLFLFFLTFTFFLEDGLYFDHTPNKLFDFGGLVIMGIAISCFLFASSFLNVDHFFPKVKYTTIILLCLILLTYVTSKVTGNHIYYTIASSIAGIITIKYWIIAFLLVRKNRYSIYFVIGYSLIFTLIIMFYLFPAFGFYNTGVTVNTLKLGSVLEIIFLNYAVVYKMSLLKKMNTDMKNSIGNYITEIDSLKRSKAEQEKIKKDIKNLLNERELSILSLIKEKKTNEEMSKKLFISVNTVKFHIKNIYRKLNIKTREEARGITSGLEEVA